MSSYQTRVREYIAEVCRGDPTDPEERRDRFFEEAVELYQALGGTADEARELIGYVFAKDPGQPYREMGQTALTLVALSDTVAIDYDDCAEDELARACTPEVLERVRTKRAGRAGRGPLPGLLGLPEKALRPMTPGEIEAQEGRIAESSVAQAFERGLDKSVARLGEIGEMCKQGEGRFVEGYLNDLALSRIAVRRMKHPPSSSNSLIPLRLSTAPRDGALVLLLHIDPQSSDDCLAEWGWYEDGIPDRCWYGLDNERISPTHWVWTEPGDAPSDGSKS